MIFAPMKTIGYPESVFDCLVWSRCRVNDVVFSTDKKNKCHSDEQKVEGKFQLQEKSTHWTILFNVLLHFQLNAFVTRYFQLTPQRIFPFRFGFKQWKIIKRWISMENFWWSETIDRELADGICKRVKTQENSEKIHKQSFVSLFLTVQKEKAGDRWTKNKFTRDWTSAYLTKTIQVKIALTLFSSREVLLAPFVLNKNFAWKL